MTNTERREFDPSQTDLEFAGRIIQYDIHKHYKPEHGMCVSADYTIVPPELCIIRDNSSSDETSTIHTMPITVTIPNGGIILAIPINRQGNLQHSPPTLHLNNHLTHSSASQGSELSGWGRGFKLKEFLNNDIYRSTPT